MKCAICPNEASYKIPRTYIRGGFETLTVLSWAFVCKAHIGKVDDGDRDFTTEYKTLVRD